METRIRRRGTVKKRRPPTTVRSEQLTICGPAAAAQDKAYYAARSCLWRIVCVCDVIDQSLCSSFVCCDATHGKEEQAKEDTYGELKGCQKPTSTSAQQS